MMNFSILEKKKLSADGLKTCQRQTNGLVDHVQIGGVAERRESGFGQPGNNSTIRYACRY